MVLLKLLPALCSSSYLHIFYHIMFTVIGSFGHCTQEMVNLLLSGRATSNVFDGSRAMGDSGLTLKGVARQNEIGYLSQLEALRYCQVHLHYLIYIIYVEENGHI